jgi:hypothetical protein
MKKGILLLFTMLMLLTSVGCETDNGVVETNAEFESYWWRDDPYFDDKEVDEEATIALGDPNVVVMASEPRAPRDLMFDRVTAKIIEVYGLSQEDVRPVMHVMLYDADTVRSWELRGVDWKLFDFEMQKIRQEIPALPPHDLCVCPVVEIAEVDCPQDAGGS